MIHELPDRATVRPEPVMITAGVYAIEGFWAEWHKLDEGDRSMQAPRIELLEEKTLVGMHVTMNLIDDTTSELFRRFMPRRGEIKHKLDASNYCIKAYEDAHSFENFTGATKFEKWAAVEVDKLDNIPMGMESLILKGGKYAVFLHQGPASAFQTTFQYIFGNWFPNSEFDLDSREQFEILPPGYRPDDPNAEEEVWIPVK
ncbi:MAG: GyrI-like domain-containing protein [Pseudomonadales bacterium]|nr:GyrI-like domain-containing protein [Pseudomonadales bacterium]